ncbi:ABC transporter permease [uncultured Peptoniphilus sp.]|uniref:ABC transporter permease n=1 Tax=uncultured Peptoniphilus sp. TaxID=254354 RepID=UPI0028063589|nr:ABC transporter permease [uncultured Peptoniphilus sp.]
MDILETIRLSLEGLRTNKMRSFLTMLGIIIGISSVIGITTIGHALTKSVNKAFETVGNTSVELMVRPNEPEYAWEDIREEDYLTKDMLDDIKENFSDIVKDYGIYGAGGKYKVTEGKNSEEIDLFATSQGMQYVQKEKLIAGRYLNESDINRSKYVAVISDKVVDKIFSGDVQKALGSEIKVVKNNNLIVFTVVGVYEYQKNEIGALNFSEDASNVYIPYNVGNREIYGYNDDTFQGVILVFKNTDTVEEDSNTIKDYLIKKYYANNNRIKLETMSALSQINQITSTMSAMKIAISAIAGISLLVGGIGVMNILLVSVTERTREIGIRKALGATRNDIRFQFITESIIICIIGGIFGIILGTGLGIFGSSLLKMTSLPSVSSIIIAVGFSMIIGVFFGYYPANKAAKLDPIEALRYE